MSGTSSKPYTPPFSHTFLAGGIAGTCEILVMYPTDVVKTRAQLSIGRQQVGMMKSLANIFKHEGLIRMYRGILPPILVEAPKRALKFSSNEKYKQYFQTDGKLSQKGAIAAGISAGITEAFVVVPFELVKIRLQDKSNAGRYKNTFDCVQKILQTDGPLGFYKGLESTLWRHAAWNGGYFGLIFTVRKWMPKAESEKGQLFYNFLAGSIAGTFGTILNTPFDVVKSRIQNQVKDSAGGNSIIRTAAPYRWALPSLPLIVREEGFSALYKGFVPKVVRLGPGGGILLVVFEFVSKLLREWDLKKQPPH